MANENYHNVDMNKTELEHFYAKFRVNHKSIMELGLPKKKYDGSYVDHMVVDFNPSQNNYKVSLFDPEWVRKHATHNLPFGTWSTKTLAWEFKDKESIRKILTGLGKKSLLDMLD